MNKYFWTRPLVLVSIFAVSFLSVVNCSHQIVEPENDIPPPDFVDHDTPPRMIQIAFPVYPDSARKAGLEGMVTVKIWVGKDGKPKKAVIQQSDAEIFNQPFLDAAMQFLFTPAMKNGRPVEVWFVVSFEFRLRGDTVSPSVGLTLDARVYEFPFNEPAKKEKSNEANRNP